MDRLGSVCLRVTSARVGFSRGFLLQRTTNQVAPVAQWLALRDKGRRVLGSNPTCHASFQFSLDWLLLKARNAMGAVGRLGP